MNDQFQEWCNKKYGSIKPVKCHRGGVHTFLGMKLDFQREKGTVHILQEEHVDDVVNSVNEKLLDNSPTPASSNLMKKGAGGLLCPDKKGTLPYSCGKSVVYHKKIQTRYRIGRFNA